MFQALSLLVGSILRIFVSRSNLLFENLAVRQQLVVLKRRHPRPPIGILDKLFWVVASRFWAGWKKALVVVSPQTVVRWHRAGFAMYWRAISTVRRVTGRKRIPRRFAI